MPLVLRVDVDKPYGNSNFFNAVRSKLSENYWYPDLVLFNRNYLSQLARFIQHCNNEKISGHFYFRMCTIPNQHITQLMQEGGHKAGIHLENTRDFSTFKAEYDNVAKRCALELSSITKHGSGKLKLGKHHYPPYEPDKYRKWADEIGVDFRFGNELCTSSEDFIGNKNFYPKIFWIEPDYRNESFSSLEELIESAKNNLVPVLIHPSNYDSTKNVKEDFIKLIGLARKNDIDWVL